MKKSDIIAKHMETLGLTKEEAEALYEADKEVDKLKDGEIDNDLTDEQREVKKKMCMDGASNKKTVKSNSLDRALFLDKIIALFDNEDIPCSELTSGKELVAEFNGVKYKVAVSTYRPRAK